MCGIYKHWKAPGRKSCWMNNKPYRTILLGGQPVIVFPHSVSMQPLIKEGKTCVGLVPLTEEPRLGDILAFGRLIYKSLTATKMLRQKLKIIWKHG